MRKEDENAHESRLTKDIRGFLSKALKRKDWYFFNNPGLCKCWEEMSCTNTRCPSYRSRNLRCWQVAGTFSRGEPRCDFAKEIGDCRKCRVYGKATDGNIILQIGEDFNNLMFQLKSREDELRMNIDDVEKKNRELLAINKKINRLLKSLDARNRQLKELSIKDELTGMYNYRFFRKILQEQYKLAKRYKFPLSCIMIDIDYFKAVNDTYGHQFGDAVLKQLAEILKSNVRDTDKVVRYGGEEFAILFPYTDYAAAYKKAEKLRKLVSKYSFLIKGRAISITISLGIAAYPENRKVTRAGRLLNYADEALYQAKERGRNQTVIYDNGSAAKATDKKSSNIKAVSDRRRQPRIQTLISVKGEMNKEDLSFVSAVDISFSGISVLSKNPVDCHKILKITLYLPDIGEGTSRRDKDSADEAPSEDARPAKKIELEGLAVWCKRIDDSPGWPAEGGRKAEGNYLAGIRFSNVSTKDKIYLQKYFVSMFKRND